ncbi:MAG: alpha/beta fold hydrolase [Dehalococcoidia bacterium]|nr:alpha/beta fold hydrolase [Dehalococcoidia bacterium]
MAKARVSGIDLAYAVQGGGFPLVLTHFSSASKEMWEGVFEPLAQRYRVVAYDLRGHGESGAPPYDDPSYSMASIVDDQRALMDHLGIERAFVLGISMGGAIALHFALTHPAKVRALLLCDTTADMSHTARSQYNQVEADLEAVKAYLRKKGLATLSLRTWLDWARPLGIDRAEDLPAGARWHIERVQRMSIDGYLGSGRALKDHDVVDRLREITAPTLVLTGDHDFLRGASERIAERMPDARFVLISDAAHITCFWQPEKFADAVLDFLADVEAGRPVAGREER